MHPMQDPDSFKPWKLLCHTMCVQGHRFVHGTPDSRFNLICFGLIESSATEMTSSTAGWPEWLQSLILDLRAQMAPKLLVYLYAGYFMPLHYS